MTDYTLPTSLAPFIQSFYLQPHVGRSESPFTRQQKIYELSAPRWVCRVSIRGGYAGEGLRGKGAAMDGFIAKLAGGVNRVLVHDFRRPTPSIDIEEVTYDAGETFDGGETFYDDFQFGANGAVAQGATEMSMTGCAPSKLLWRAGDYVGGDGRPHIVTDDVSSDASGNAVIPFRPPSQAAIEGGEAVLFYVRAPFRLVSDDAGANPTEVGAPTVHDFELVEDL